MRLTRRVADSVRSPARLAAFAKRAFEIVAHGELSALLARLRARSPSPSEYRAWLAAQPAPVAHARAPFVIALDSRGMQSVAAVRATLPEGALAVLVRDLSGGWSRPEEAQQRPLGEWLRASGAQWVWWLAQPARFEAGAADAIAQACAEPRARVVYADHDVEDRDGRPAQPCFKSAWDAEQIVERDYAGPLLVVHVSLAAEVDAASHGVGGQWSFLVRCASRLDPAAFVHVPRVLLHLSEDDATTGRESVAEALRAHARAETTPMDLDPSRTPWVRYALPDGCTVSVVVPTRDRVALLARCLRSVLACALPVPPEIVVVDNGSTDPALATLLAEIGSEASVRTVRVDEPFNFARLCNAGVEAASGRVVVLLNNDARFDDDGSLAELAALAARERTGAVGPLLLYPDGRIQSAGVLVGVNRTATSALEGFATDEPAARRWCGTRRRVSAVIGACLAIERRKYRQVGGMDEALAVSHNEVDLGLRLEAAGWSNVFTPFARVTHDEGASRGFEVTREERARLAAEEARFVSRWADVLRAVDPAHHPSLARHGNAFALGPPLAPEPRSGWREGRGVPARTAPEA